MFNAGEVNRVSERYNQFEAWLDGILAGGQLPAEVAAVNFNIYDGADDTYDIEMIGAPSFDEGDDDWACEELYASELLSLPVTPATEDWEDGLSDIMDMVRQYMATGSWQETLKTYQAVGVGHVNGAIEVVYRGPALFEQAAVPAQTLDTPEPALTSAFQDTVQNAPPVSVDLFAGAEEGVGTQPEPQPYYAATPPPPQAFYAPQEPPPQAYYAPPETVPEGYGQLGPAPEAFYAPQEPVPQAYYVTPEPQPQAYAQPESAPQTYVQPDPAPKAYYAQPEDMQQAYCAPQETAPPQPQPEPPAPQPFEALEMLGPEMAGEETLECFKLIRAVRPHTITCKPKREYGIRQYELLRAQPFTRWNPNFTFMYQAARGNVATDLLNNSLGWLLVSGRLKALLESLESEIEYFPVQVEEESSGQLLPGYWVANLLRLQDALSLEDCDYSVMSHPVFGQYNSVKRYALRADALEGADLFKLPDHQEIPVFVTNRFRRLMEENGITGLAYYPVGLV